MPTEDACAECAPLVEEATRRAILERGNPTRLLERVEGHCGKRPLVRAQVLRARGYHQRSQGLIEDSIATLIAGREAALEVVDLDLADEIALTLSGSYARAGEIDRAGSLMVEIADRRSDLIGDKARSQLGAFHSFTGNCAAGVEVLVGIGETLEKAGEFEWAARSFGNLGWCLLELGEADRAIPILQAGRDLWLELDAKQLAGGLSHHLSAAYALLGRPIEALRSLQEARKGRELEMDDWLDAAELYYEAGLVDDSLANGRKALAAATTPREEGLCQLALARLFVDTGRYTEGLRAATAAADAFRRAGIDDLRYSADVLAVEGRLRTDNATQADMELLEPPSGDVASRTSFRAQSLLAELALSLGDLDGASRSIEAIDTDQATLGLAADVHLDSVKAKLTHARGSTAEAIEQISQAMREIEERAAAIGITDLTVGMRGISAGLADLGLSYAVELEDVPSILEFADRARALDVTPRIRMGEEVEQLLQEYRGQRRRSRDESNADPAAIEQTLRDLVRVARATGTTNPTVPVTLESMQADIGGSVLALFFETRGDTYRLTVTKRGTAVEPIGTTAELESAAAKLRSRFFDALRLADHAELTGVRRLAGRLDERMFKGLDGDGPVVLVPPPGIYGVPWPLMPQLTGRHLTINASPSSWLRARRRRAEPGSDTVLVAGPEPPAAVQEVEILRTTHPDARPLTGSEASVERVLEAIDGAGRVHLATHGHARTDNPIFSTLELADGPVTLYELQTVAPPCEVVVSACSVGKARTYPGGLAVGMPNVLLAAGSRSVVAAELQVPDEPTRRAMIGLYQRVTEGASMPEGLSAVTTELLEDDPAAGLAAAAFNAYGA